MKKMKKKKTIIVFIVLITLVISGIVSASLYDEFQQLQTKNCNLIDYKGVSFSKTELIDRFGLTGATQNCTFVLDYLTYHPDTEDLVWFLDPWYSEIEHIFTEDHEYLFLLGEDQSALENIVGLAADYRNHEILRNFEEVVSFPEEYYSTSPVPGPSPNNCVDNSFENIYVGNAGSYDDEFVGYTEFASFCINESILEYPFCEDEIFYTAFPFCDCFEGKCIASVSEVFYYADLFGLFAGPRGQEIDSDFLFSAIKSWINN